MNLTVSEALTDHGEYEPYVGSHRRRWVTRLALTHRAAGFLVCELPIQEKAPTRSPFGAKAGKAETCCAFRAVLQ